MSAHLRRTTIAGILVAFAGSVMLAFAGSSAVPNALAQPVPPGTGTQQAGQTTTPTPPEPAKGTQEQKELQTIISTLIAAEKAFLALSVPLNIIIGKLLSNDWVYLDGDAYKAIETIWILVRNIVNIVFAILLLVIAIAQIAGAATGSESKTFAIKQILPGFIFGLVFVNFSLLACRLVLDAGSLATTAAFSIVSETGPNLIANSQDPNYELVLKNKTFCWPSKPGLDQIEACKGTGDQLTSCIDRWATDNPGGKSPLRSCMGAKVHVAFGSDQVQKLYASGQVDPESWTGPENGIGGDFGMGWSAQPPGDLGTILFDARNVMMVYTNSIFRLPEILTLYNEKTNTNIGTGTGVLMTTLLTLIFGAIIIMVNVALVLALGIRLVLIWMILIFSPLMALEFVSDGKFIKGFLSNAKLDKGLLRSLVDMAFMPAVAGIILSLGFILFHVLNKIIYRTTGFSNGVQSFKIPPFDIQIHGGIIPVFSTLGEFIVALILLVVLWQALFQMMQTNKWMDGVVKRIDGLGKTIAGNAKMIPFIPMPGGGKGPDGKPKPGGPKMVSWATLNRGVEELENAQRRKLQEHERAGLQGTWFEQFLPERAYDERQAAKLDENLTKLKNQVKDKEVYGMPLSILVKNSGSIASKEDAKRIADNMEQFATKEHSGLEKDNPAVTGYLTALKAWRENPTGSTENIKLRAATHVLYTAAMAKNPEMAKAMEEAGLKFYSSEGFKKPTEPESGETKFANVTASGSGDKKGGRLFPSYTIQVDGQKAENIPSKDIQDLSTALRAYNAAPAPEKMTEPELNGTAPINASTKAKANTLNDVVQKILGQFPAEFRTKAATPKDRIALANQILVKIPELKGDPKPSGDTESH